MRQPTKEERMMMAHYYVQLRYEAWAWYHALIRAGYCVPNHSQVFEGIEDIIEECCESDVLTEDEKQFIRSCYE